MSSTETFIRKAMEAGYQPMQSDVSEEFTFLYGSLVMSSPVDSILLDPDLWRCAGKALGWGQKTENPISNDEWRVRQVGLIQSIQDGQTADDYLAGLLTDANGNE